MWEPRHSTAEWVADLPRSSFSIVAEAIARLSIGAGASEQHIEHLVRHTAAKLARAEVPDTMDAILGCSVMVVGCTAMASSDGVLANMFTELGQAGQLATTRSTSIGLGFAEVVAIAAWFKELEHRSVEAGLPRYALLIVVVVEFIESLAMVKTG